MDDGRALKILTSRIVGTVESAGSGSAFSDECGQLLAALSALEHATEAVLECPDLDLGLANATLYLDSFGYLVVGWLWLKQALVAQNKLGSSTPSADRSFYEGKIAACRYFFRYELPTVFEKFALVGRLDDTCINMAEDAFLGS
jgi:butyryl-CoA dehydrogenase